MDAAGPPIEAAIDDDICVPSGSKTSLVGLLPFLARRQGTRPLSSSHVEHALSRGYSQSYLASSTGKVKGNVEVVRSAATCSDDMASSSAGSLGSPATRKVEMDRWRGRGGHGMAEVVRAGRAAICGAAYRGVLKMVASMDLFNHKPM